MLTLLSTVLLFAHVLSLDQSQNCNKRTEYLEGTKCCKKCSPGELMTKRCTPSSDTECKACSNGYYNDDYNNEYMHCNRCKTCDKKHMEIERNCTLTHDAVCTCIDGYRCNDSKCQTCVEVQKPVSPKPTPTPTTDKMWISVSLCFACVCVCVLLTCFLLISRHGWPCKRIISASTGVCIFEESESKSSECTEEETVPMPVQEVCEQTEKLEV